MPPSTMSLLLLLLLEGALGLGTERGSCPAPCRCFGELLDCSRGDLLSVPENLPGWAVQLDLSQNKLSSIKASSMSHLHNLRELRLNRNDLKMIPNLGPLSTNITLLSLTNNKIDSVLPEHLQPYHSLETLDLSNNLITELKTPSFPVLRLKYLYINKNLITSMESGAFDNLSATLQVLKLNKNRIGYIPPKMFKLSNLQHLELKRNRIKHIDGLAFQGLDALKYLTIQRNGITRLMDGAFWGLSNMEVLLLDHNNLTEISRGWLYGLLMLQHLHLGQNAISRISPDAWEFCQKLSELDLTFNELTRLEESSFMGLSLLGRLFIGNNQISNIADGAFHGLSSLNTLDLKNNEISWTIEDMNGAFSGLDKLKKLMLQGNRIGSITKKAFSWLEALEYLDLSNNAIMSMQSNAFSQMKRLQQLHLNTSSLLCDCQLKWLPQWLTENKLQKFVNANCAHPQSLKGKSIFSVSADGFVCDDFPKPQITVQPETQSALKGSNVTFICSAASSSDSPMTFSWKKDNEILHDAEMESYAHQRVQGGDVMAYTTILRLRNVEFISEGKYQCVISNHFGTTYSVKARLTVNMLPSFTKMPIDLTIRAGSTARLECAAVGHPTPQIAWQKNGGTDFPAARERRMHVMPEDDVFFIVNAKIGDTGVYSCTAQNSAGSISANATLTVLETPSFLRPLVDRTVSKGETTVLQCIAGGNPTPKVNWTKDDNPLTVTERHFFAAGNQLLILVDTDFEDAGKYTCEMSNILGTERGNIQLSVIPNPTCDSPANATPSLEDDGWATVGVVIIAVVCCVVGTSLVWVVIIYHTRRKNEDCSVTNTDETNLPVDTPSYLSSQGTLAERQEGYISENGSHHFITSSMSGYFLQQRDTNGICHLDNESEADLQTGNEPLYYRYMGQQSSLYLKGSVYNPEGCEIYHTGYSSDQRSTNLDAYEADYSTEKGFSSSYTQQNNDNFINSSDVHETFPVIYAFPGSVCDQSENNRVKSDSETELFGSKLNSDKTLHMGTFGKSVWKPPHEPFPKTMGYVTTHSNDHSSLDIHLDCDNEKTSKMAFTDETGKDFYKQKISEDHRTPMFYGYDIDT
ncbi:leucine-rich repeats and immunoglobulin-like domains protein 3 [Bufo gargarizans]|uniref:leucine-rich repeats and immunoglobulin-like domains protein 3 n=1 Tax=Bufo gargarizans TaxID=30331 RepID=UPI001CF24D0B|nr:leucine-rich repeats and immunoglobulin-like domains protein 3 [Bufo gargarizans]